MNKDPVLILGGRSDIGLATAHQFAAAGHAIQLAARDVKTRGADRDDIAIGIGDPGRAPAWNEIVEIERS